jgi:iron complex outermembrane receptor protein
MKTLKRTSVLACSLAISMLPDVAAAQNARTQALEEVVVTATRRAETAQDVPVSLTPLSADALEDANVIDITDVGFLAPNVQLQPVASLPGFATFSMRGIGVGANSIRTIDPTVQVLVDGMVVATQIAGQLDMFDYERIEILRGPQGIFFGRNSIAGAVSLNTAKPSEEFGGRAKFGVGAYGLLLGEGMIEGSLSDNLRGKLAVQFRQFDGFFEDDNGGSFVPAPNNPAGTEPGSPRQDQMMQDSIFIKPTITWTPTDSLEVTLFGQYYYDDGGSGMAQALLDPAAPPPPMVTLFGYTPPRDQFSPNNDLFGESETDIKQLIAEVNWEVGKGVLTSVTGVRDLEFNSSTDVDGTPFLLIHFPDNEEEASQFSQEIRYAVDLNESMDLIVGAFYMDAEQEVIERREFSGLTAGRDHFDYNYIQSDWSQDVESMAVFGNLRYSFTEKWSTSVGLRYTRESKDLLLTPLTPCSGPGFTGCATAKTPFSESWNNTSPRVTLEYRPTDGQMYFASWTRGFRSGNFNARAPSLAGVGPADPEQADQFEIGLKGDFLDGTLRTNVSVFYTMYDNIQRISAQEDELGNPLQVIRNAADADIMGLEFEATWLPTDYLTLQASFGYVDPQFNEFTGLDLDGTPGLGPEDEELAKNLKFERIPDYEYTLVGSYRFPLANLGGDLTARAQYTYRDDFFTEVTNIPERAIEGHGIFDASLTYENEDWRVSLWGRNLNEETYAEIISFAFNLQRFGGQARTYGVEVSYNF